MTDNIIQNEVGAFNETKLKELVAAKNLNREYIGFEINDEYYQNILKRLGEGEKE